MLGRIYPILGGCWFFLKKCFKVSELSTFSPKQHICSDSKHKKQREENREISWRQNSSPSVLSGALMTLMSTPVFLGRHQNTCTLTVLQKILFLYKKVRKILMLSHRLFFNILTFLRSPVVLVAKLLYWIA